MRSCSECGNFVLFGGLHDDDEDKRYCDRVCAERAYYSKAARSVSDADLGPAVLEIHGGPCPRCAGPGPVDLHVSYRVMSALVVTFWSNRPAICCRRCGIHRRLGDAALSLLLGWWGVPAGLVLTPIQVVRNVIGLLRMPDPSRPSAALE